MKIKSIQGLLGIVLCIYCQLSFSAAKKYIQVPLEDNLTVSIDVVKATANLDAILQDEIDGLDGSVLLLGQAKKIKNPKTQEQVVQIIWTELRDAKKPKKRVVLNKPLTSNFKYSSHQIDRGQNIIAHGDKSSILLAAKRLKDQDLDAEEVVAMGSAANESSVERRIFSYDEDEEKKRLGALGQNTNLGSNEGNIDDRNKGNSKFSNGGLAPGYFDQAISQAAKGSVQGFGKSSSGGGSSVSMGSGTSSSFDNQPNGLQGIGSANYPNIQRPNQQNQYRPQAGPHNGGMEDGGPKVQGDDIPHGQSVSPAGDELPGFEPGDREQRNDEEDEGINIPDLRIEYSAVGCMPRVDEARDRVVIQKHPIVYRDNEDITTEQERQQCSDTQEFYLIQKRYNCPECTYIHQEDESREMKAYARFQKYWVNEDTHEESVLNGGRIFVDREHPYRYIDEPGNCLAFIDVPTMFAHPEVETVFYDRENARQIVANCHVPPENKRRDPIRIVNTKSGCPLIHHFPVNYSREQQRGIYELRGAEIEAIGCVEIGPPLMHQWSTEGCESEVDPLAGQFIRLGKRQVRTPNGQVLVVSDHCEPMGGVENLESTRAGCEGQFYDDFNNGRSYAKKLFYYIDHDIRRYTQGCIRSNEYYVHDVVQEGYQQDDANLTAYPLMALYINGPEGRVNISPASVRANYPGIQYELVEQLTQQTGRSSFEGCYRVTETDLIRRYRRPDQSVFEVKIGVGDKVRGDIYLCTTRRENRQIFAGHRGGGHLRNHNREIWVAQHRTITIFPDGHEEAGEWG
jgi:hypothetical protein